MTGEFIPSLTDKYTVWLPTVSGAFPLNSLVSGLKLNQSGKFWSYGIFAEYISGLLLIDINVPSGTEYKKLNPQW